MPAAHRPRLARRSAGRRRARRAGQRRSKTSPRPASRGRCSRGSTGQGPNFHATSTASRTGGWPARRRAAAWDGTKALIEKGHDAIIAEIKNSGLRGRGGAGFPTGLKWSFMPKSDPRPSYLVINADESEPGSCKDREIMRHDPHLLIEGALLASFAMRAHACYTYVRGEFIRERERLRGGSRRGLRRQADRQEQHPRLGLRFHRPSRRRRLYLRRGDRAAGKPRGQEGPAAPEAAVPGQHRPLRRADHRQQRRIDRGRARLSCAAARPGLPASVSPTTPAPSCFRSRATSNSRAWSRRRWAFRLRELLERHAGGVRGGWDNLLAVIPGGSSMPCLPPSVCQDLTLDFDTLSQAQIGHGHGGRDRHGQVDRHHRRHPPHRLLLQARELRPVHALPGGLRLDVAHAATHGARRGREERDRSAAGHDQARSRATRSARSATARPGRCRDCCATSGR